MKITICGSMAFAKEMLATQKQLVELGHEVLIPLTTDQCLINPNLNSDLTFCIEKNVMKNHFDKIAQSDAVLVLNYPKNDINGYIGGSALMETAVAHHLNKKIFILNELPDENDLRYSLEIKLAKPIIINGDLTKIT